MGLQRFMFKVECNPMSFIAKAFTRGWIVLVVRVSCISSGLFRLLHR